MNGRGLDAFPRDAQGRLVLPEKSLVLFWSKVEKRGPDDCWEWIGSRERGNYGACHIAGTQVRVHRLSFEIHNGPVAPGALIHHTCHNRPCVNPAHLEVVTHEVNSRSKMLGSITRTPPGYRPVGRNADVATLFWSYVDKTDICWLWLGPRLPQGYGIFHHNKQRVRAHRFAYELSKGPVPPGYVVRHLICDNPPCCNPDHLEIGTHADNTHDTEAKGRGNHPKGQKQGSARLKDADIPLIIQAVAERILPREIASEYGISKSQIWRIVGGKSWQHVLRDPIVAARAQVILAQRRTTGANAILTREEASLIFRRHADGEKVAEIAKDFPAVSYATVYAAAKRRTWRQAG